MSNLISEVSAYAIPVLIFIILGYAWLKGVNVYEAFVEGAGEGVTTILRVFPYLVAMFMAIGIFRSSGAMEIFIMLLTPMAETVGIPAELIPLALIRPLSGMASAGILSELFKVSGPDSLIGRTASTVVGSTETVFYTLSLYFGSIGISKVRHTLWAALFADSVGFVASIAICRMIFGD